MTGSVRMARRLLPLVMVIVAALVVIPGDTRAHDRGMTRQTYGEAMRWYRERAEAGDPKAQFYHGLALEEGLQGRRDPAEAVTWFARAAEAGHAMAQYRLGVIRQFGGPGAIDLAEARRLYGMAAAQGMAEAMYNLGVMLQDGAGGPRDPEGAGRMFEQAARGGIAHAFLHLAHISGNGAEPDLVEALSWAMLAERAGAEQADSFSDALRASVTREQVAEAEARASAWQ